MYSAGHADIMKHKKDVGGESMLTLDMVREAQEALRGIARRTPLDRAPKFGENVYIKAENLQLTGAFKLRGAYNKIRSLTPEEAARGVIACSAGNHAQGIALSASRLGIKAVICMPAGAPISKVEATRGYGAEVVLVPGVYDDAAAEAERLTKEQGYTFAHPFNDPLVIAGQGTIGLEILEQLPPAEKNPRTDYLSAIALSRMNRPREGLEYYLKAIQADPVLKFRGNLDPEIQILYKQNNVKASW